jgi:hypothetical protein
VYFVARGVLTTTPNDQGDSAQPGLDNLYVFEHDAQYPAGRTAFIGTQSAEDEWLWSTDGQVERAGGVDASPDGRFLVFASTIDLTPDDTSNSKQIFEYDAQTGSLVRVSIGQNGFNNNGNTGYESYIPSPNYSYQQFEAAADSRDYWANMALSGDGSYVFFQTRAALTPQVAPGEHLNAYEYHDGNVYLIGEGTEEHGVLLSTDMSGRDVFLLTATSLVSQDTDTDGDIYDAHIDGGFPPPLEHPECLGDACQGSLSGAPVLLSPGSEFQAGGNPPLAGSVFAAKPAIKKKARHKKAKRKKKAKKARNAHRRAKRGRK